MIKQYSIEEKVNRLASEEDNLRSCGGVLAIDLWGDCSLYKFQSKLKTIAP